MILYLIVLASSFIIASNSKADSIVRIKSFVQKVDERTPWKREQVRTISSNALVIDKDLLLVSSKVVDQSTFLEAYLGQDASPRTLKLEYLDNNAQLAILKLPKPSDLVPLTFAENVKPNQRVEVKNLRNNRLETLKKTIREFRTIRSRTSFYPLPVMVMAKGGRSVMNSAPIFCQKKVCGLVIHQNERELLALPSPVIRKFLNNYRSNIKDFAKMGIATRTIPDSLFRKVKLKNADLKGLWIERVFRHSAFRNTLKVGDVVTQVDGIPIDRQGYLEIEPWGKLPLSGYTWKLSSTKPIELNVWRDGKEMSIKAKPSAFEGGMDPIPLLNGRKRPFIIINGIVFAELTRNFLYSWGAKWIENAPMALSFSFLYGEKKPAVFIANVFPRESNRVYRAARYDIVKRVNENEVGNLAEFLNQIQLAFDQKQKAVIDMGPIPLEVILDLSTIAEQKALVSQDYSTNPEFFWLPN
ncbi:MAG: hypothetical protein HRU19_17635 [Pseudobacteriovorax sp.]|nr:hypothetical protein [Pseudobacteriovorax sp.]